MSESHTQRMRLSKEESANQRVLGTAKENLAADYLKRCGLTILAHSFRCRLGEIDLVAREKDTLVFAEVKYRKNAACGHPEEAVDARKRRVILKVALFYLSRFGIAPDTPIRFDVIAIEGDRIRWVKDAFSF